MNECFGFLSFPTINRPVRVMKKRTDVLFCPEGDERYRSVALRVSETKWNVVCTLSVCVCCRGCLLHIQEWRQGAGRSPEKSLLHTKKSHHSMWKNSLCIWSRQTGKRGQVFQVFAEFLSQSQGAACALLNPARRCCGRLLGSSAGWRRDASHLLSEERREDPDDLSGRGIKS